VQDVDARQIARDEVFGFDQRCFGSGVDDH
jgi:hypothetical protein